MVVCLYDNLIRVVCHVNNVETCPVDNYLWLLLVCPSGHTAPQPPYYLCLHKAGCLYPPCSSVTPSWVMLPWWQADHIQCHNTGHQGVRNVHSHTHQRHSFHFFFTIPKFLLSDLEHTSHLALAYICYHINWPDIIKLTKHFSRQVTMSTASHCHVPSYKFGLTVLTSKVLPTFLYHAHTLAAFEWPQALSSGYPMHITLT